MDYQTDYVLISRNPEVLAIPAIRDATTEIEPIPGLGIWTDDFNNLFRILG
jgi:hypothetical protein